MGDNDMLSQEEIEALLNGFGNEESSASEGGTEEAPAPETPVEEIGETAVDEMIPEIQPEAPAEEVASDVVADVTVDGATANLGDESADDDELDQNLLDDLHKDTLGEIGNISMGSAATTLSMLLNQKVNITTPKVTITNLNKVKQDYPIPCLLVDVKYTIGLMGSNILMIEMRDAAIIADLMMGGTGTDVDDSELSEIHLSAVSEAMNQMMGSTATSISGMIGKKIDISPPFVKGIDLSDKDMEISSELSSETPLAKISFRMEIGDLINSNIMQLVPVDFATEMVDNLLNNMGSDTPVETVDETPPPPPPEPAPPVEQPMMQQPMMGQPMMQQPMMQQPMMQQPMMQQPINVQSAQFAPLNQVMPQDLPVNIGLLMDVPLQATVELGRTKMPIKEILDLGVGSIIELDKLAGEPVDLVVNGKLIAKGEVVVIEENFGLRITDILSATERVKTI